MFSPTHELRYFEPAGSATDQNEPFEVTVEVEIVNLRSATIEILTDDPDGRPAIGDEVEVLDEEGNEFTYRYVGDENWVCLGETGHEESPAADPILVRIIEIEEVA